MSCTCNQNKVLVLYVFHEYNDRVKHFIEHCIFYDATIDFIIISNNKNTFSFPHYVNVLFRDNIGYDFGGWSDALLTYNLYEKYTHFIFVNSSVMGPFIESGKWTDSYINGLQNNVKLFGSTINATVSINLDLAHVQSYIFAMNKTTLKYLIECDIFSKNYVLTYDDAVWKKEVLMSRKIIEKNWNIGSLMTYYKDVDFTFKSKPPSYYDIEFLGDVMFPQFENVIWNKHELVFIKGNRHNLTV